MILSRSIQRKVDRTIELARALKPTHQTGRAFHVTTLWSKSHLLSVGVNNYHRQHPAHRFMEYRSFKDFHRVDYQACLHSEISALLKLGEENLSGITLVNTRILNDGMIGMARPCPNCAKVLEQLACDNIFWTNNGGRIESL